MTKETCLVYCKAYSQVFRDRPFRIRHRHNNLRYCNMEDHNKKADWSVILTYQFFKIFVFDNRITESCVQHELGKVLPHIVWLTSKAVNAGCITVSNQ